MPSLLIDIGANIARLQQDVAHAQKSIQGFARSTESAFKSIASIAAMGGLTLGMGQAITAFMDAEKASMKMAVAMKNQGDYTKAAMADMQEYAAAIQRTTASEDDAVLSVMANLKTYGMMNEEVKKSTQAVLDLAAAKQTEGMTIERASELIGKAYMGETTALKRVGIVIDENIPKTEAYAKVMEQIQGRFGGAAAAELETYAGQWKKIKNQFSDVAESVGIVLLKALEGAAFGANMVAVGFYTVLEAANKLESYLAGAVGFSGMADYGRIAAEEFGKLKDAALESADKTYKMFNSWGEGIDKAVGKMKDGTRTIRELSQKESEKLLNKVAIDQFKDMVKTLTEFEKESAKVGKSIGDQELIDLNVRYENYKRFVTDEAKLEQWLADEKKSIMIRANNETIALWEELYKQTQNDKYAQAAIDAMKDILDAEEQKWRTILDSDDDAHTLRLKREQDYVDKIKGMIQQVAIAEQQAVAVASRSVYDASYLSTSEPSEGGPGQTRVNAFGETEKWSAHGLGWITGSSEGLSQPLATYNTQITYYTQQINDTAQKAADIAQKIADENKRIAEEYQREYDARVKTFQTAKGQFTDYVQERERRGWGAVQYQQQFAKLAGEFESSQYFETSIDLLGQMIDVIKELDSIAQDQLEQQKQQTASLKESNLSISDWLMDLSQGSMAPVQSSAMWATRFEELKAQAMADESKVAEFLAYAQKYLEFEKSYGTKGSYTAAYQSTVSAVSGLGDYMSLAAQLSNLGLGDSLGDIQKLIKAFGDLGVSAFDLKKAADDAAGSTSIAALRTESLGSAADVLKAAAGTAAGSGGMGKIIEKLIGEGYTNLPDATGNATAAIGNVAVTTESELKKVAAYWEALASKMGMTMNAETALTAIGLMQPPVTQTTTYTVPKFSYLPHTENAVGFYDFFGNIYYITPSGYKTSAPGFITWYEQVPNYAKGGLASGPSIFGEKGPEWAVPTYEPERSNFLRDVGADPEAIGNAIAKRMSGMGGGDIHVSVQIDGREIGSVVAKQMKINRDLRESTRMN